MASENYDDFYESMAAARISDDFNLNFGKDPQSGLNGAGSYKRSSSTGKQQNNVTIPPHLIAEAMQAMRGEPENHLDVRWSAPISPDEMRYVEDYVKARYPEIYMERVVGMNLPRVSEEDDEQNSPDRSPDDRDNFQRQRHVEQGKRSSVRGNGPPQQPSAWFSRWQPSGACLAEEPTKAQLCASRLQEIMSGNAVTTDDTMSVTEIHVRSRILQRCGVDQAEYHVVFTREAKDAFALIAEAYPFHKHNVYMMALDEKHDFISRFAGLRGAKKIEAPLSWLDLNVAGSQLSTHFRKKSKSNPKGLFAYPVQAGGLKNSLHWVSEAQRNLWHVLLDATEVVLDADASESFNLQEHKPDYLVCTSPKIVGFPYRVTCLLIRRASQSLSPPPKKSR